MPTKYRKKPVVIDAIHYEGTQESRREVVHFMGVESLSFSDTQGIFIPTLEGTMTAAPGDWIIRGVRGEYYPCKPDIFAATYDPA